ncbi:MAG: type II toxin-antitoxin system Phd/YefM family antitoxin [Candidatus Eremiobacteraeota bacterium]|nr:type II toxin-antitoxin system Phd/YefM family antitoxin [Candidatus Eremiobacteraeota bacterium]
MTVRGEWQVQEAKSRLSEVLAKAERLGPQSITKHGKPVAVLLSIKDFNRLQRHPRTSLREFLAGSGFDQIDLERDRSDLGRDVPL